MKFKHIGVPTKKKHDNEEYMADAKLYITNPDDSEHKIEWLRFEDGSPMPEVLQTTNHIAYIVDDVAKAMEGKECLIEPFEAGPGVMVGFVMDENLPVEYMSIEE